MAIDPKKTLARLKGEDTTRGRVTLYLDKDLYEQFRKSCGDVSPSKVVEEFMRDWVTSLTGEAKKK